MDANLREHFDRAVGDDPGADPGEMAHAAIVLGGRMRRRRRRLAVAGAAASVMLAAGALGGVTLLVKSPATPNPPTTIAAAMMPPAAPACSAMPVESDATDVLMFLDFEVSAQRKDTLAKTLAADARVQSFAFESHEAAFQRFRKLWADEPDFVASVTPEQLPESFRVRLTDPAQYTAFHAKYAAMDGFDQFIGRTCPASAPVGGVW